MRVNEARNLSRKAKKALWQKACKKERADRSREKESQRLSAIETIRELPSRIEEVAREGKAILKIMPLPYYVTIYDRMGPNSMSIGSIRKYLSSRYDPWLIECRRKGFLLGDLPSFIPCGECLEVRTVALWLLRNGFEISIRKERDRLGNTMNEWLVAFW